MKKALTRIVCIILLSVFTFAFLSGCKVKYANYSNYSGEIPLPDDGIVRAEVFESLKKTSNVAVFCGKHGNISYQWTVFGSDIDTPQDIDFRIFTVLSNDNLHIQLSTDKAFGFSPVLSVYLPERWDSLTATVYDADGSTLCGASLTNTDNTIVNFTVCDGIFVYDIKGDDSTVAYGTEAAKATADPKNTDSESTPSPTAAEQDDYLSKSDKNSKTPKKSDGSRKTKDKYGTEPVPEGKQEPVEPEDAQVDKGTVYHCTFSIECATILNNLDKLSPEKVDILPKDGVILKKIQVEFYDGESVFDVLQRVCRDNKIHLEATFTPVYNSAYIEGIGNIYEMDCGELSGWCYRVNGWYPNYGCSRYALCDGDNVEFRYTCDLGRDIGSDWKMDG